MKKTIAVLFAAVFAAGLFLLFSQRTEAETFSGSFGESGSELTWSLNTETGELFVGGTGNMPMNYGGLPWDAYNAQIRSLVIQDGVTSVSPGAFCYAEISEAVIPDSVTVIGPGAFGYCPSLVSIRIGSGLAELGDWTFSGCSALTSIEVDPSNPVYHSAENCLIQTEKYTLVLGCQASSIPSDGSVTIIGNGAFNCVSGLTSITIPDTVTTIGESSFSGTGLISVELPASVTSIGYSAFSSSSLTSITIPESVEIIGWSAFMSCENLESVTIPASVTTIETSAFYGCTSLREVKYYAETDTIPWSCFNGCENLTEFTLSANVTTVDYYAFERCTALETIIFLGSEEQWDDLTVLDGNDPFLDAAVTFPGSAAGDLDGDGSVTASDAIYLLYSTFYPAEYPLNGDCDFNGDGSVTASDAIYLLYFTFYPDDYPLA